MELTVENRYPGSYRVGIHTGITLIPTGDAQPLRLTPVNGAAGEVCEPQESLWPGIDPPDLNYFMAGHVHPGGSFRCRVAFEVLPAAIRPQRMTFQAGAYSGLSAGYYDPTPDDNLAHFVFGRGAFGPPPLPVPWASWPALAA